MNSVNFLSNLSKTNNIHIIEENPFFMMIKDKTLGLFPWGFNPQILKTIKRFEKCDYGFGHFEMDGIELVGQVSSGNDYNYKKLFDAANYLFSGHFHLNKTYPGPKLQNKLQMVGSALQLDWGDFGRSKFIYTLDLSNDKVESFENTVNAKFEKVYYSKFMRDLYTKDELKKLCKHNFVKFVIDTKYQFNDVLKYTDTIKEFKPVSVELEYLISLTSDIIMQSTDDIIKSNSKDNLSYLLEYVEKVYKEMKDTNNDLNLQTLREMTNLYYKKSQLSESERQEKTL